MNIDTLLQDEIQDELQHLKGMAVGSDEYKTAVDGITKLTDRTIEMKRLEQEQQLKEQQMKEDRIDRWIRNGLTALGIAVPAGVTIWGALKTFKFEETGTITSDTGKKFLNGLFSRR